jgi:hypothetical protein
MRPANHFVVPRQDAEKHVLPEPAGRPDINRLAVPKAGDRKVQLDPMT